MISRVRYDDSTIIQNINTVRSELRLTFINGDFNTFNKLAVCRENLNIMIYYVTDINLVLLSMKSVNGKPNVPSGGCSASLPLVFSPNENLYFPELS